MTRAHAKRLSFTLAKWALTLAALYYVLHEIDGAQLQKMWRAQNPYLLAVAGVMMVAQAYISTHRWQKITKLITPENTAVPSFKKLFSLNYISMFFNCCLPGTVGGDVLRVMLLKSPSYPLTLATHGVIIDRLFAVLGIVMMIGIGAPWLVPMLGVAGGWWIAAVIVLCVLRAAFVLRMAQAMIVRLPDNRMQHLVQHFLANMQRVIAHFSDYLPLLAQAIFAHGVYCLAAWLIAQSMEVPIDVLHMLLFIPPMLLISLIPVSVGGWGVREMTLIYLLAHIGIEKEMALMISVQLGLVLMVASLPGALIWLRFKRQGA